MTSNQNAGEKLFFALSRDGAQLAFVAMVSDSWMITRNGQVIFQGDQSTLDEGILEFKQLAYSPDTESPNKSSREAQ
jgi:hypothetical protein